jgi:pyruvate,orthophosphate dikinase
LTDMKQVMLFSEAVGNDRFLLGGKGYGLVEMTSIGLPVPQGFVVTTDACKAYYSNGGRVPEGLFQEIRRMMDEIGRITKKGFGDASNPLLVSVRSGAPFSMPGMMDTILNLGLNDEVVKKLASMTGDDRFAFDAYRRLIQMFGKVAMGVDGDLFEQVLDVHRKRFGVKSDIELPASDLWAVVGEFKEIVRARTGKDFPQDVFVQLDAAVEAVFRSWNNTRAKEYRKYYGISETIGTAVNVQTMVFGNMGPDSGSGVGFTRNPSTGERKLFGEYLPNSQGEDLVAGVRTPIGIDGLDPALKAELADVAARLEGHFRDMQDFEFTVEKGKFYILQTRNGKRTAQSAVRVAVEMADEGLITKEEAVTRINPDELNQLLHRRLDPRAGDKPIAKGLNASPGAATGKVIFDTAEAVSEGGKGERIILVRSETTPEDIKGLIASQGVLTMRGGMTSHAAVVARGMGKAAVVGCSEIEISQDRASFKTKSGDVVRKGDSITIDGTTGTVFKGEIPTVEPGLTPEFTKLLALADRFRRLGIWANADTPEAAKRARDFGAQGIGLCRTERMFNAPNRLPIVREMIMSRDAKERNEKLYRLFPFQLADFKAIFSVMKGEPVIVRLLDLPLHEFLPTAEDLIVEIDSLKERHAGEAAIAEKSEILYRVRQLVEHNPMLGHRGCRLAVTYPEIYEMQTKAILRAAIDVLKEEGETVRVKIMLPLVSHFKEMVLLRGIVKGAAEEILKEAGVSLPYEIGTMVETPRAALTAEEIAHHADFFSFGTNDLTQMTFAFSRDDVEAKFMARYLEDKILEESPFDSIDTTGVGRLVRTAVTEGRKANPRLEVGICGEHGGDPKSIKFFHEVGLNYVSCSTYRIPIAKLAAAQAALAKSTTTTV